MARKGLWNFSVCCCEMISRIHKVKKRKMNNSV